MPAQRLLFLLLLSVSIGCAGSAPPPAPLPTVEVATQPRLVAVSWSSDGETILAALNDGGRCTLVAVPPSGGAPETVGPLEFCPDAIRSLRDGSLLISSDARSVLRSSSGENHGDVLASLDLEHRLTAANDELIWPDGSRSSAPATSRFRLLPDAASALAVQRGPDGERLVRLDRAGESKVIAGPFSAIDSFDISPDGKEAVFSARRESFDVALVSTDGGEPYWVGPDRLDERMVSWAPRGSKITYRIDAPMGAVLRSVHVPTGFQRSFAWAGTSVRDLSWQPRAEEFVVIAESPTLGPHARIADYAGESSRTVLPGVDAGLAPPEPAGGVPDAWISAPAELRYNERVPLVVWLEEGDIWRWSEPRAALQKNLRVGMAVLGPGAERAEWLSALLAQLPWADPQRVYVVARGPLGDPGVVPRMVFAGQEGSPGGGEVVRVGVDASDAELAALLASRLQEVKTKE